MAVKFFGSKGGAGTFKRLPDTLRSEDTVEIILGLGEGPWKGLKNGLQSVFLDDTPLENIDGTSNFKEFVYNLGLGYPAGEPITPNLGGSSVNTVVSAGAFSKDVPVTRTGTHQNINFIDLRFIVSQLVTQNDTGVFGDKIELLVEMKATASPTWINPFINDPANISFGGKAVGTTVTHVPTEFSSGLNWSLATPGVITIRGKTTSTFVKEIRVEVPLINDTWDIRITLLNEELIQNDPIETHRVIAWESFQEITSTDLIFPDTVTVQVIGQSTDQFTKIPTLSGIFETKVLSVPPIAIFDPNTRIYTGTPWDGMFAQAYTNDPAWIISDLVENTRYGLAANSVGVVTFDKWSALEASKYFSEPVPDGSSGTEPRYSLNVVLQSPQNGKDAIRLLAGAVNSTLLDDGNGTIRIKVDKDDPAVALFTPENVFKGLFEYNFTDITTRYNDITVTYLNKARNFDPDRRRVFDQVEIDKHGRIALDFAAIGCTGTQEALRRAKARLLSSTTETKIVSFNTNRLADLVELWDVILIADPLAGYSLSGRVHGLDGARTTLTLRDPINLEVGIAYKLTFQIINPNYLPGGITVEPGIGIENSTFNEPVQTIERNVTNVVGSSGDVTVLTIDLPLPADIPEFPPFSLNWADDLMGGSSLPKPFRVVELTSSSGNIDDFRVTAIEINRAKYAAIDAVIAQSESLPVFEIILSAPTNLIIVEEERTSKSGSTLSLNLSWDRSPTRVVRNYEILMQRNGSDFSSVWKGSERVAELIDISPGDYIFQIFALDRNERRSLPLVGTKNIISDARVVTPITNLRLVGEPSTTIYACKDPQIAWDHDAPSPFFSHYSVVIKKSSDSTILRTVNNIIERKFKYDHLNNALDSGGVATRGLIFEVTSVDFQNNVSAIISLTVDNTLPTVPGDIALFKTHNTITVTFTPPTEIDYLGVQVLLDTVNPPTTQVFDGNQASIIFEALQSNTQYWIKLKFRDTFDTTTADSAIQTIITDVIPTLTQLDPIADAMTKVSGQNLLGSDAEIEHNIGALTYFYTQLHGTDTGNSTHGDLITLFDVVVGDVISALMDMKADTGTGVVQMFLRFLDGADAIVGTSYNGNSIAVGAGYGLSKVENITIPVGAIKIEVRTNASGTATGRFVRRAMVNKGPIALSFVRPPIRSNRENLDDVSDSGTRFAAIESGADATAGKGIDTLVDGGGFSRIREIAVRHAVRRSPSTALNLVFNPGFEDDGDFWDLSQGTIVTDSTKAHSGNKYLQLIRTSVDVESDGSEDDGSTIKRIEVNEGDVILLEGWIFKEAGNSNCRITGAFDDKDFANPVQLLILTASNSGVWEFLSSRITVPSGKKYVRIRCQIDGGTTTTTARFDDIALRIVRLADHVEFVTGETVEQLKPTDAGATKGAPVGTNINGVLAETVQADSLLGGDLTRPGSGVIDPSSILNIELGTGLYTGGGSIDSFKPAELGSDVTSNRFGSLLLNGSFETGTIEGWTTSSATVNNDPGNAHQGNFVLRVQSAVGGPNQFSNYIPVKTGDRILATCWAKRDETSLPGSDSVLRFREYDGSKVQGSLSGGDTANKTLVGYQHLRSIHTVVDSDAEFVRIDFDGGEGPSGHWFVDEFSFSIFPKNIDIDALALTNAPIDIGATSGAPFGTNINGVLAETVQADSLLGGDLTRPGSGVIDKSSIAGIELGTGLYTSGGSIDSFKPAVSGAEPNPADLAGLDTIADAMTKVSGQNLLGSDAGPEHDVQAGNYIFNGFGGTNTGVLLTALGGKVGDSMSAVAEVSTTGPSSAFFGIILQFFDVNGTLLTPDGRSFVDQTGGVFQSISFSNVIVPANTIFVNFQTSSFGGAPINRKVRNASLNLGPIALPFAEPPIRGNRENAGDIKYVGGSTLESKEPAEIGSDVTKTASIIYIDNPDFEGIDKNVLNTPANPNLSEIVNDPSNAFAGSWVGKFTANGPADNVINIRSVPVTPGQRFIMSTMIKGGTTGTAQVRVFWRDAAGTQVGFTDGPTIAAGSSVYQETRQIVTSVAGTVQAQFGLVFQGPPTGIWYFDARRVQLIQSELDIDALALTNAPAESGADATAGKSLTLLTNRTLDNISDSATFKKVQSGLLANRPAFGTANRLYHSTDTKQIFRDTAAAWELIADPTAANNLWSDVQDNDGNRPANNAGVGSALNKGRLFESLSQWYNSESQANNLSATWWSIQTALSSVAPLSGSVLQIVNNDVSFRDMFSERIGLDVNKNYRVRVWARQITGDRISYLHVAFYDINGNVLPGSSNGATGWTSTGSYNYWRIAAAVFPSAWTFYEFTFGPSINSDATIPVGAVAASIGGLFSQAGTTNTTIQLQDYRLEEIDDRVAVGLTAIGDVARTLPIAVVPQAAVTQHQGAITAGDVTAVGGTAAATVRDGANRANSGLTSAGDLNRDITDARKITSNILKRTGGGLYSGALDANKTTDTNQLADGANLGGTAAWAGVTGTGKPADNADVTGANTAKTITTPDTRNANDLPGVYQAKGRGVYPEFKLRSVIGAPGTTTYGMLETKVQWTNDSGGVVSQVFRSLDGEYRRTGTNTGGWGAWGTSFDGQNNPSWIGDLADRPIDLTDGRVPAGLTAAGDVNRSVPSAKITQGSVTQHQAAITAGDVTNVSGVAAATVQGGAAKADAGLNSQGQLLSTTGIDQGNAVIRSLTHGLKFGNVTHLQSGGEPFALNWAVPPSVQFLTGGLTSSASLTGDQVQLFQAQNLSISGFTPSLLLQELIGAGTPVTDTGAVANGSGWDMDKTAANAFDNSYKFGFDVIVGNSFVPGLGWFPGSITVGVYTDDGTGPIQRDSIMISGSGADGATSIVANIFSTVVVTGLTNHAGKEFKLVLEGDVFGGSSITVFGSVKYTTAGAPASTSATPAGKGLTVLYAVMGGQG